MDEDKFYKSQLMKSERFGDYADILNALLEDCQKYTIDEADSAIQGFLKKEVQ